MEEIQQLAEPFKFSLVGKFLKGRPSIDKIRAFFVQLGLQRPAQISLLDKRHILIKLNLECDFSRLWGHQIYFLKGNKPIRIFKWTAAFRCSEESSMVSVWISLPFSPIHYMHNKDTLFAIASIVDKPLRVDHATAVVSRPSMARILIKYDIVMPLIPKI